MYCQFSGSLGFDIGDSVDQTRESAMDEEQPDSLVQTADPGESNAPALYDEEQYLRSMHASPRY